MSKNTNTMIRFVEKLAEIQLPFENTFLIYDDAIHSLPDLQNWIANFPFRYGVRAGENLKNVENFSAHLNEILRCSQGSTHSFCGLGGGSISDFTGFVSSIWNRGQPFTLVPTTWLCAVDSAHGGKNALNLDGIKNIVGTFHAAQEVIIPQDLLLQEPLERFQEGLAEILKVSILTGNEEFVSKEYYSLFKNTALAFSHLSKIIDMKMSIVHQDIYDKNGVRARLNFGHTLGHALESLLNISHGQAVALGMRFAIEWSFHLNFLNPIEFKSMMHCLDQLRFHSLHPSKLELSMSQFIKSLNQDKKRKLAQSAAHFQIPFVFVEGWGKPKIQVVSLNEIVNELDNQKWVQWRD